MTVEEHKVLTDIANNASWDSTKRLKEYLATVKPKGSKRTNDQNAALHLWFDWVATTLNDAGYGVQAILKETVELQWTPEQVKEILWKSVQKPLFKLESTKELSKVGQIDLVYDHLVRFLGEEPFCIEVPPFPSNPDKDKIKLQAMENLKKTDYPEYTGAPTI